MKPYYDDGAGIQIFLGDCREVFPAISGHDVTAVITDPPYGISVSTRVNHRQPAKWDTEIVPLKTWLSVGQHHMFWGAQYYAHELPLSESWACWVKRPMNGITKRQTHTTIELAWSDFGKPRFYKQVWDGGKREGCSDNRLFCHPAQKPSELMSWCIASLPDGEHTVLDPFMGSGTTLRAAKDPGCRAIGIEIEERYCEIAARRLSQQVIQWEAPTP